MKMTVFHVFLLVFVMWAVHSHGRAYETESIIYNNTQLPYKENMNPETVMNSEYFDFYYLALQWPNSYCSSNPCRPPPPLRRPNHFVVHGLWPQRNRRQRNRLPLIDCSGSTPFNIPNLNNPAVRTFVRRLTEIWPNLKIHRNDIDFWRQEYNGHGICYFRTSEMYLESTFLMWEKIQPLTQRQDRRGLSPRTSYTLRNLRQEIFDVTKSHPMLICIPVSGIRWMYLLELRFCFNKREDLINCTLTSNDNNCGSSVYLP